jgi:hypothetical protein
MAIWYPQNLGVTPFVKPLLAIRVPEFAGGISPKMSLDGMERTTTSVDEAVELDLPFRILQRRQ